MRPPLISAFSENVFRKDAAGRELAISRSNLSWIRIEKGWREIAGEEAELLMVAHAALAGDRRCGDGLQPFVAKLDRSAEAIADGSLHPFRTAGGWGPTATRPRNVGPQEQLSLPAQRQERRIIAKKRVLSATSAQSYFAGAA
jgi:hypothetical protein